jgi:hypothetical protein
VSAGEVRGTAGGARRVDSEQAVLMAIAAALADAPLGAEVELQTSSSAALAIAGGGTAGEAAETASGEDRDLRAAASSALRRVRLVTRRAEPTPGGPVAFAAAWAEFARDRAKDRGDFTAVIPKSNLAKAGL